MIALNLQLFGGGGSGSGSGGKNNQGGGKPVKLGAYVTSRSGLQAALNYILYNPKDDGYKNAPGSYLIAQIEEKKLWYDKDAGMWVSKSGKRYDIRKRR